ncbi:hypothetical protein [Halarchaeum sp. P4]|uniref:hypothetical protein n=1 Tax=Halarchaeum sp. P4 TaxID=3421639 RepID=UPI003EB98041
MVSWASLDSSTVWFVAFLVATGIGALLTGSAIEGALIALLLVGLGFVVYTVFS